MRRSFGIGIAVIAIGLAGCDKLSENLGPEGQFFSLHASPDLYQAILFVGENDRRFDTTEYGGRTNESRVGVGRYNFIVEVRRSGGRDNAVALEFEEQIREQEETILVWVGNADDLDYLAWNRKVRGSGADNVAPSFGHADESSPAVDIYLEAPGADLLAATPRASLAFGEFRERSGVDRGDYEVTVTTQGNPGDVLFRSAVISLSNGDSPVFVVMTTADFGTSPLLVRAIGDETNGFLEDVATPPELRALHSAFSTNPVDVVIDSDFANPLISNLAFQETSAYVATTADEADLTIAEAGSGGGVLFVEGTIDLFSATFNSTFFWGEPGDLSVRTVTDNRRRLAVFSQFRGAHGAANFNDLDIYIVPAGENFRNFIPLLGGIGFTGVSNSQILTPDSYDLVVTQAGDDTVLARVNDLELEEFGLYSVLVTDNVDPNVVDIVFYDDDPTL